MEAAGGDIALHQLSQVRFINGHRACTQIGDLGRVLAEDGWQERVATVSPGSEAKTYALTMLRKAMEGDTATVETMIREGVKMLFHLGLEAEAGSGKG